LVDWMEGLSCEHEPVKKHGNESQKFTASERKTDEMNPVRRVVSALHGDCSRVVPGPLQKEIATEHTEVKKPRGLIRKEKLSTKEYFEAWAKFDCDDSSDDEDSGNNDANDSEPNSCPRMKESKEMITIELARWKNPLSLTPKALC